MTGLENRAKNASIEHNPRESRPPLFCSEPEQSEKKHKTKAIYLKRIE